MSDWLIIVILCLLLVLAITYIFEYRVVET